MIEGENLWNICVEGFGRNCDENGYGEDIDSFFEAWMIDGDDSSAVGDLDRNIVMRLPYESMEVVHGSLVDLCGSINENAFTVLDRCGADIVLDRPGSDLNDVFCIYGNEGLCAEESERKVPFTLARIEEMQSEGVDIDALIYSLNNSIEAEDLREAEKFDYATDIGEVLAFGENLADKAAEDLHGVDGEPEVASAEYESVVDNADADPARVEGAEGDGLETTRNNGTSEEGEGDVYGGDTTDVSSPSEEDNVLLVRILDWPVVGSVQDANEGLGFDDAVTDVFVKTRNEGAKFVDTSNLLPAEVEKFDFDYFISLILSILAFVLTTVPLTSLAYLYQKDILDTERLEALTEQLASMEEADEVSQSQIDDLIANLEVSNNRLRASSMQMAVVDGWLDDLQMQLVEGQLHAYALTLREADLERREAYLEKRYDLFEGRLMLENLSDRFEDEFPVMDWIYSTLGDTLEF